MSKRSPLSPASESQGTGASESWPPIASQSELVLYTTEDGATRFYLRAESGSVWLSQLELAALFQTSVPNINIHIRTSWPKTSCRPGQPLKMT